MAETKFSEQLPPEGDIVFTVIDDQQGRRNEALLRRRGGLMYFPDDSMYVYYDPTHWRPATEEELELERTRRTAQSAGSQKQAQVALAEIDAQIERVTTTQERNSDQDSG